MTDQPKPRYLYRVVCSWCKSEIGLRATTNPAQAGMTSHGICHPCRDRERRAMARERIDADYHVRAMRENRAETDRMARAFALRRNDEVWRECWTWQAQCHVVRHRIRMDIECEECHCMPDELFLVRGRRVCLSCIPEQTVGERGVW